MYFSGSQSEGNQKMTERRSPIQKHTSEETPRCVRCALLPVRRLCSQVLLAPIAATAGTACGALVNTSVYLKPVELLNVALNVLTRLAPCLNLGIRKLGHKDLLDTVGSDNRRK